MMILWICLNIPRKIVGIFIIDVIVNADHIYDSVIDNLSEDDVDSMFYFFMILGSIAKRNQYQDALKRMQDINDQTMQIEANLKQFANSLQSISMSRDS